jgi:hypothetical protein
MSMSFPIFLSYSTTKLVSSSVDILTLVVSYVTTIMIKQRQCDLQYYKIEIWYSDVGFNISFILFFTFVLLCCELFTVGFCKNRLLVYIVTYARRIKM